MRRSLVLAAAAALACSATAMADIGIVSVTPSTSRPGQTLRVHVNGYQALLTLSMPVVLVRSDLMPRPYRCRDSTAICEPVLWRNRLERRPYWLVGFARHWTRNKHQPDHADALLRFRTPRVRPGHYMLALWCGPCVRGPQGSLIAGPNITVRDQ
jgi:hypothetical protein